MTTQFPLHDTSTRIGKWTDRETIRVLIAEADLQNARSLRDQLIRQGYQVVGIVCSGLEALEYCWEHAVDVALMEQDMPEMTGMQVAQLVMQTTPTCIIMLTSAPDQTAHRIGIMHTVSNSLLDSQIRPIITTALARFGRYIEVRDESADTQAALRDWLAIDTTLQRLMQYERSSEEQAFEQVRKEALKMNCSLAAAAQLYLQR